MPTELVWDCAGCHVVELVEQPDGDDPVCVGDKEPCIYCEYTAYVRHRAHGEKVADDG